MGKRELIVLFTCVCLLSSIVVYVISGTNLLGGGPAGSDGELPTPTPSQPDTSPPTDSPSQTDEPSPTPTPSPTAAIDIELNGNSITVSSLGVATVAGSKVTITSAGTYRVSGLLTDGQVIVDTDDEGTVRLILDGVNIHCSNSAPIYVSDAKNVVIVLQEDTDNYVADGASYVLEAGTDEPNAAIFSKSDLTILGDGSLTVNGNYNDGIASKDGLIIKSGTINVSAVDDGIRGKDYLVVRGGDVTLNVGGDGLKSDNAEDVTRGYVSVESGVIAVTSGGDAVQASTDVIIAGGKISLTSGGGSNSSLGADVSAKGIKAGVSIIVDGGTFMVDSADDAVHSNGLMTINGGSFVVSTGDDGFHANSSLTINGGDINVTKSFEGLESVVITINGGVIYITASDDGINVAGDNQGNLQWGLPLNNTYSGDQFLYINGGYIYVDALGDGFDINGGIVMTDGVVIINGPVDDPESAVDSAAFNITGGFLIAAGAAQMSESPGYFSTQYSVLVKYFIIEPIVVLPAGTLFHIQNSAGTDIVTFAPTKQYASLAFSSPTLTLGETYKIYVGGNATGTVKDGLYTNVTYTPGFNYRNFTITDVVTIVPTFPL